MGAVFSEGTKADDVLAILKRNGVNYARLRFFHAPDKSRELVNDLAYHVAPEVHPRPAGTLTSRSSEKPHRQWQKHSRQVHCCGGVLSAVSRAAAHTDLRTTHMHKGRLEAFSDGVIAILITIMVLELHAPHGTDFAALREVVPTLLSYVLSFVFLAIYWNSHHHLLQATHRVSGSVLWANLHLLFWLSLVPFVTNWRGENHVAPLPTAVYGVVLLFSGVAFWILQNRVIALEGQDSTLARAVGRELKGKASIGLYVAAIGLAFVRSWMADVLFITVALMWLAPDPRIERALTPGARGSADTATEVVPGVDHAREAHVRRCEAAHVVAVRTDRPGSSGDVVAADVDGDHALLHADVPTAAGATLRPKPW